MHKHRTYLYCQVLLFIWFRQANCSFQKFDDDEDEDDGDTPPTPSNLQRKNSFFFIQNIMLT